MKKYKSVSFRIDARILSRFKYVAQYNCRSMNRTIQYLIEKYIQSYEAKHGAIILPEEEEA